MPDYSIFVLGESQMTISNGTPLDGVTQGSGVHMMNQTITLNSNAWTEVQITDNDPNFQDSDGSQQLNGTQTIDGVSYNNGTRVEAEYALTLTDGTNSWTVIGYNVNNSSPAYGTVEGLAFIGGPGGFPPLDVPLTVVGTQEGPNFASAAYATPICFDAGTLIATGNGPRPIEPLAPGDLIQTADNGLQPIRWCGGRHVIGAGRFAPVEIAANTLGAHSALRVSQQHRILVAHPTVELLFGVPEVLVSAVHFLDHSVARLCNGRRAQYFHLMLDRHEVIFANGLASESLLIPVQSGAGHFDETFGEALRFFPELKDAAITSAAQGSQAARPCLRAHEAHLLSSMAGVLGTASRTDLCA